MIRNTNNNISGSTVEDTNTSFVANNTDTIEEGFVHATNIVQLRKEKQTLVVVSNSFQVLEQ